MEQVDDIIQLLPDSVANQIAAGEVIQRPASVIKELVENSVDAGAKNIDIVVKDAGKSLIQVIDDGKGMSVTDARMAFERHATSKIRCADDLFSLHTMGFRGEALPSIAAVSELEISTRRDCDEIGTKILIRASKVDSQEPAMTAKGTNIKVKNLFYNFVARRRFLKKDSVELSHIVHEFERLALVNTDVAFKFTSNGVLLHSLPRGPLKNRITSLFGKTIGEHLIPVRTQTSLVTIDGFISLPAGARQRGQRQFLFVNGRFMRHPYFHRAILSCYDNIVAKDTQPHYFINFTVAPDRIDVNIHPQKYEIKFEDEQSIWQILTASIREALGRHNASTGMDFNAFGTPDIPPVDPTTIPPADLRDVTENPDADYNPFFLHADYGNANGQARLDFGDNRGAAKPSKHNTVQQQTARTSRWERMFDALKQRDSLGSDIYFEAANAPQPTLQLDNADGRTTLFQLRNKYIVTEGDDGLVLIDMHRAHVNLLFHALVDELKGGKVATQTLMFSEPLDLDASEKIMLDSAIDLIERIGFSIGKDDNGNYTLEGVPGSISLKNPTEMLKTVLDDLAETGNDVEAEATRRAVLSMARASAMRGGQTLTTTEMEHLVKSLFALAAPGYTPDGLKVVSRLTDERLASFFD